MRFNFSGWSLLVISLWILNQNYITCQFFSSSGYFPRAYGHPFPFDYYHHKTHPSISPVNFIPSFPMKPLKSIYGPMLPVINDAGMFAGPPPPPLQSTAGFRQSNLSSSHRDNRFLNLFTVVQFPRDTCTTLAGDNGTCLSMQDCQIKNGIPTGTCANNFGVCCVFMSTCGATIVENGTYFVNKAYPQGFNGITSCQIIVNKSSPEVCQYRLDFEQFILAGPEPINHICNYDQFIVTGSSPVPIICGLNTGNHIYVDSGPGSSGPVVLLVTTNGAELTRRWKIRITQIPCPSTLKADEGCLQYFTGVTGLITSFNFEPSMGLHLSNQDYSICIRPEQNFCSIQYSQCIDSANNRSHSFTLTGNTLGQNAVSSMVDSNNCNTDWLIIPCAENIDSLQPKNVNCVDRICGGTFSTEPSTISSIVSSGVKPFRMHFHTNSVESPDMGNVGFCLRFVQQPCNNKT